MDTSGQEELIRESIEQLYNASITPASRRKTKINTVVDEICGRASGSGLRQAQCSAILRILIESKHVDQASRSAVIKSLYPLQDPSVDDQLLIIGSLGLGDGKPSLQTQSALLRWITLMFNLLHDIKTLQRCYSVLFNLLDMMALRANLCHLLVRLTQRKHVQPFRIQTILELAHKNPGEAAIIGLLRTYKTYNPNIVLGELEQSKSSYFPHPDPEWLEHLRMLREQYAKVNPDITDRRTSRRQKRSEKRNLGIDVPEMQTSYLEEGAVSLEELTGPEELVEKIESIILPNQISSSIREPLFRDFLNLCPSEHAGRRLDDWLTAYLEDQLHQSRNARALASPFEQVLRDLTDYGRDRGRLPSRMAVFLQEYFDSGLQLIDPEILSDLLLYSCESLPDLSGFESSVLDGSESSLRQLLKLQIQLIVREAHKPADPSGATSSETDVMGIANLCTKSLNLSIAIIETFPNSQQGISAVLSALELMSASMISSAVAIIPPPPLLVYRLLFEPSVSVVSRLCGVLNNYKVAMEEHDSEKAVVGEGVADILNSYLMDVCNCLWRNRAFSLGDLHAKACLMDPGSVDTLRKYLDEMDVDVPLQSALSFSHNPTLALISKRIVEEWLHDYEGMQDGVPRWNLGPVTQKSLDRMRSEGGPQLNWQQFRGLFLRWLDQRGLEGLGSLIRATIQGA